MLTADVTAMPLGGHRLWVIEADLEYGHATAGPAAVSIGRDGHGSLYIESAATGGCYTERAVIDGEVEAWFTEDHFIALFPAEAPMRDGGRRLVVALGDRVPIGVHRVIAGQRGELEAGQ
jgi:hypothetical protein